MAIFIKQDSFSAHLFLLELTSGGYNQYIKMIYWYTELAMNRFEKKNLASTAIFLNPNCVSPKKTQELRTIRKTQGICSINELHVYELLKTFYKVKRRKHDKVNNFISKQELDKSLDTTRKIKSLTKKTNTKKQKINICANMDTIKFSS